MDRQPRARTGQTPQAGPAVQPLVPPTETPPAEGSVAEAHPERPDGGMWEHPRVWLTLIVIGAVIVAGYFIARIVGM
ncbi:DUF6480 family protein [Streptomyces sp. NBC_00637]|uniref:DUF6480 family protein n=1 Tax=Streptomyces sp. NBC_00637 TaxID=2903667 RepID=UPI00386501E9